MKEQMLLCKKNYLNGVDMTSKFSRNNGNVDPPFVSEITSWKSGMIIFLPESPLCVPLTGFK